LWSGHVYAVKGERKMEPFVTTVRGIYRFLAALLLIIIVGIGIIITALLPGSRRGITRSMRLIPPFARRVMKVVNVEIHCPNPDLISRHEGILVSNHISYVDVVALLTLTPLRFLAKAEIRRWPLIGLAAHTIGCVFVKRRDRQARAQTRAELAQVEKFPPIVVFPEGTRSVEPGLLPFRYGSFQIAIENGIPILPCALVYTPESVLKRRPGESMPQTMWRLTAHKGPVRLDIIPLDPIMPDPAIDKAAELAQSTQATIEAARQNGQRVVNRVKERLV
jgi:1-acyl-sn-glycerol-3-phosphate acyltransferase